MAMDVKKTGTTVPVAQPEEDTKPTEKKVLVTGEAGTGVETRTGTTDENSIKKYDGDSSYQPPKIPLKDLSDEEMKMLWTPEGRDQLLNKYGISPIEIKQHLAQQMPSISEVRLKLKNVFNNVQFRTFHHPEPKGATITWGELQDGDRVQLKFKDGFKANADVIVADNTQGNAVLCFDFGGGDELVPVDPKLRNESDLDSASITLY